MPVFVVCLDQFALYTVSPLYAVTGLHRIILREGMCWHGEIQVYCDHINWIHCITVIVFIIDSLSLKLV